MHYRGLRIPEGEDGGNGPEKIFEEKIAEKFLNLERKQSPKSRNRREFHIGLTQKRNTPRHIVIKMTKIKDKERILKATREKQQITYKGTPIKLSADFSHKVIGRLKDKSSKIICIELRDTENN